MTDEEKGFEAIENGLPKIHRFFCWNHLMSAMKLWLKRHGASASELHVYVNNIWDLLHQKTKKDYEICLSEMKVKWSLPFLHYFMFEIHDKVGPFIHSCWLQSTIIFISCILQVTVKHAVGRWNLEEYHILLPYTSLENSTLSWQMKI